MRKIHLLILFSILCLGNLFSQISYNYKVYTTEDGLLSNECYKLFQDSKGYLWIANGNGISKFNGKKFENYTDKKFKDGLANVTSFIENTDGNELYANTEKSVYNLTRRKYIIKDSTLIQGFISEREIFKIYNGVLDKDFYKIYIANRRSVPTRDTVYYSFNGKYNYAILPHNNFGEIKLICDINNNCYIKVQDTINKIFNFYSFQKGILKKIFETKDNIYKIEIDNEQNFVCFSNVLGELQHTVNFFNKNGLLIKKTKITGFPCGNYCNELNCVFDKNNNIWIPNRNGILKLNLRNETQEYIDNDREINYIIQELVDGNTGNVILIKDTVIDNYKNLVSDNFGNFIYGDRIFNGEKFSDLLDYSIMSKIFDGNFKGGSIRQILVDRENNIWIATSDRLFKFTPIPIRFNQNYLSKTLSEFKLKHTDALGRKFFIKEDNKNRKFSLKVFNENKLLFSKEYFKSELSESNNFNKDNSEVLEFYNVGDKTLMLYNAKSGKYALTLFDEKEIKSYSYKRNLSYLFSDSNNIYFKDGVEGYLVKVNLQNLTEHKLNNFWHRKLTKDYLSNGGFEYFEYSNSNKVLCKNLTLCKINSDFSIDTIAYGNLPNNLRYNILQYIPCSFLNYNLLVIDKRGDFYLINETSYFKLKTDLKLNLNQKDKSYIRYDKALKFGNFLLLQENSQLLVFDYDSINKKITLLSTFTYENGLPSSFLSNILVFGDYLVLSGDYGENVIYVFKYQDFLKNGLNNPIKIKLPFLSYQFTQQDGIAEYFFCDKFFNTQEPKITIYDLSYSKNNEHITDTTDNHVFPSSISNLTFKFDAVSLTEGDYIQIKYNLIGFDTNWVDASNTNELKFLSLPPGTYTLQIKACNNHNYWNKEPKQLIFTIEFPWYRTWTAYFCFLLSGIGLMYWFVKNRTKQLEKEKLKLEETVALRTNEIVTQKHLIEEKNKEITDSINYAQKIQSTLMASESFLDKHLKQTNRDYFVLYQPKDIVSGDYYWAHELEDEPDHFILLNADCTGHGVPGAFMSLLCISYLNEIVKEQKVTRPDLIFNQVRDKIVANFKVSENPERKDGMDAVLCRINFATYELNYSAANNPIVIIEPDIENNCFKIVELDYDKMPVGVSHDSNYKPFTNFTYQLKKNSFIYTFTDGFADQFGGPKGKKFMYKQLRTILLENSHLSMREQKEKLKTSFENWKGEIEQVDDVCLIGIKIE